MCRWWQEGVKGELSVSSHAIEAEHLESREYMGFSVRHLGIGTKYKK